MPCIYKITNTINGKVYVGQTIKSAKARFTEHKYFAMHKQYQRGRPHLYSAMEKYGCDNFKVEVLETCPRELLDEREVYWIAQCDSYNKGYNMTLGGQGATVGRNTEGIMSLWESGLSISDIAKAIERDRETVANELKSNGINDEAINQRRIATIKKKVRTPVYQYDKQGNFIRAYDSVYDAEEQTGINRGCIRGVMCGRHQVAGEYQWRHYKADNIGEETRISKTYPHKVYCHETGKTYRSLKECGRDIGVDHHIIRKYIDGKRKDDKYHFTLIEETAI